MRLHELEQGKIYIGEDGKSYEVINHILHERNVEGIWFFIRDIRTLTQNFTPKKVKRTFEERVWLNKYPHGLTSYYHKTREEADINASANRIACIEMVGTYEIEVEE